MPTPFLPFIPNRLRQRAGAATCCVLGALSLLAATSCLRAQRIAAIGPGVSLLPSDVLASFKPAGSGWGDASVEAVPVQGQFFATAARITVRKPPSEPYYLQLNAFIPASIHKGDAMLATFWARSIQSESGEAVFEMICEQSRDPYTKSSEFLAVTDSDWRQFTVPFKAAGSYAPGQAQMNFRLGYAAQTLEIGGVTLADYGKKTRLESLPFSGTNYPGCTPGASWRKAAAERIDRIRKADIRIVVTDGAGVPIPGARVVVAMTKHAFGFGSAVAASNLLGTGPDSDRYRDTVKRLFNKVVLESDLKWPNWQADRRPAMQATQWLRDNGLDVRGHNLVWPSWRWLPRSLDDDRDDPHALRKKVDDHITDEVTTMKGQLVEWDVLNEPYANHDLQDILGKDSMVEWFKLAHAADPAPLLFVNDYDILAEGGTNVAHQDSYEATIRYLLAQGAPLQGIGLQSHFDWDLTPPDRLLEILDRFAKLGLPLESTEFDVDITDWKLQADYFRDFMTVMFSYPRVNAIIMWGFWEGRHWRPNSALFRKDWSVKPNGVVWQDLVLHQWWTNVAGDTDLQGRFSTRGFLGEYRITACVGARNQTVVTTLAPGGREIKVALP